MGSHKETGQIGYDSYARFLQERRGMIMRSWDELSEDEHEAWREAAHMIMRHGWAEAMPSPRPTPPDSWPKTADGEGYLI